MENGPLIRIGHLKLIDHLMLGITAGRLESGSRDRVDFSLEIITMNTWNQAADELLAGTIDGAMIPAPFAIDLFQAGFDHKLVLFAGRSGSAIVKNRASRISKLSDFRGKTVLFSHELSVQVMLFHRLMASVGLTLGQPGNPKADVFLEIMPYYMMLEALQSDTLGDIGGFVAEEPVGTLAVKAGSGERLCSTSRLWPGHPGSVLVLSNDRINDYPDSVKSFVYEYMRSIAMVQENLIDPESAAMEFFGQERDVVQQVFEQEMPWVSKAELIPDIEELGMIQAYMVDNLRFMRRTINLDRFVDTGIVLAADQRR